MQNPQRSFSGRRTTGTKTDTLPRTARSWIFLIIIRAHPAGKLGEGATAVTGAELCERLFQSTPPARGGDGGQLLLAGDGSGISIHAPREGGDIAVQGGQDLQRPISIHAPREGGDSAPPPRPCGPWYFNPRPPRGGGDSMVGQNRADKLISIHAPREGGDDTVSCPAVGSCCHFNPRPPRGGRPQRFGPKARPAAFQSTPPARGATIIMEQSLQELCRISIHAPREGGDYGGHYEKPVLSISIHAPPRGGRRYPHRHSGAGRYFNPRPPRGGATTAIRIPTTCSSYFNPRPPRGGRRRRDGGKDPNTGFQSTPPARGATARR